jgi:hypothetical protein
LNFTQVEQGIRRHTDLVGIFPDRDAIPRLVGSVCWPAVRRTDRATPLHGHRVVAACRTLSLPAHTIKENQGA